jgi:sugar lactone lactonase YvrE
MRNNVGADGSSGEAGGSDGILVRVDPNRGVTEWKRDIGIANTVAWSPDHTRFYFADTLENRIWVYSYDIKTGSIEGERTFFQGFERGLPDGSSVDSEGYLLNCRYSGKCIVRVAPDGEVDRIIEMPVTNVTSCTFGGTDYRTLYITTAANGAPENERLAGGLFSLRTSTPGQPENRFRAFG